MISKCILSIAFLMCGICSMCFKTKASRADFNWAMVILGVFILAI